MRRDPDDFEPRKPVWCSDCNALVFPRRADHGIGPWECHGRGWHHDWVMACPDCDGTDLCEPPVDEGHDPMLPSGATPARGERPPGDERMSEHTKYWIGDHVWSIQSHRREVETPCAECDGKGGVMLKTAMAKCEACYGRGHHTHWEDKAWHVVNHDIIVRKVEFTVYRGEREERYMCEGTGVGTGTCWDVDRLWPSLAEAQAECDRRNAQESAAALAPAATDDQAGGEGT